MTGRMIEGPRRVAAGIAALLVVAAVVLVTAMTESTMQPAAATAPADQFSAERAMAHLKRFATRPRPMGSPARDQARDYLVGQLRVAGLAVEVQRSVGARSATGLATFGRVDNIVATLPGTDPTGTVVLVAHHDSATVGPGASDDAAAVAATLETVRALRSGPRLRNDLVVLLTDGEEDGVLGADAFARNHPLSRSGGVVLNWEARGVSGPSLLFETSPGNARLVEVFADAVPYPRGDSSLVALYRLLPNNSDFTPLTKAGFRGLNFAYIEGASRYHTADDSIAHLHRGSLQHHGTNMLALARAFGSTDIGALASEHDTTYFRAFGFLVRYPDVLVWPLALLAVAALVGLTVVARRRQLVSIPRTLLGAVSALAPLVMAVVLAQGLWALLAALRPSYDAMGGLLHRPAAYQAAVVALATLALLCWYLPLRRRVGPAALAIGALAWPTALGVLCAQFAPGASYLFTLPALCCALGGLAVLVLRRFPVWQVAAATIGVVMAAMVLPALARTTFDGMGLALGGVSALVVTLFGSTLLPVLELLFPEPAAGLPRRTAVALPLVAGVLAVALTGAGLALDRFDAAHPDRTHLAYVVDADSGAAHWVSADDEPGPWTRRYVSRRDASGLPPGYARGDLWSGEARPIPVDGPQVTVVSRTRDTITLRVASRRAGRMTLRIDQPITEATTAMAGHAPITVPVTGVRANTWPTEVRFRDLPPAGATLTVRIPGADKVRLTAIDESLGLSDVPGFVARPPGLTPSIREDGEVVAVTRTYEFPMGG